MFSCFFLFFNISFSNRVKLVDFLLRRVGSKQHLIKVLCTLVESREVLEVIAKVFDLLNKELEKEQVG